MHKPEDYKLIEFWDRRLGSPYTWTQLQQSRAAKENAPITAIYRDSDGRWRTIEEVDNQSLLDAAASLGLMRPLPDSGVREATITVTVLYRPDEVDLIGMSLADIEHEITVGSCMGTYDITGGRSLNVHQLKRAAEKMGGDADFFNCLE